MWSYKWVLCVCFHFIDCVHRAITFPWRFKCTSNFIHLPVIYFNLIIDVQGNAIIIPLYYWKWYVETLWTSYFLSIHLPFVLQCPVTIHCVMIIYLVGTILIAFGVKILTIWLFKMWTSHEMTFNWCLDHHMTCPFCFHFHFKQNYFHSQRKKRATIHKNQITIEADIRASQLQMKKTEGRWQCIIFEMNIKTLWRIWIKIGHWKHMCNVYDGHFLLWCEPPIKWLHVNRYLIFLFAVK